jgi:hypothetical protein
LVSTKIAATVTEAANAYFTTELFSGGGKSYFLFSFKDKADTPCCFADAFNLMLLNSFKNILYYSSSHKRAAFSH